MVLVLQNDLAEITGHFGDVLPGQSVGVGSEGGR